MTSPIVEAFSISHAAILNGTTGAEEALGDVYGVKDGSLEPDTGDFDNTGDDAVLSSWFWFNYATVSVQAGYISFPLISLLTGISYTSSGTTPNEYFELPIWSQASLNIPSRPMVIRCPSKDKDGLVRHLDFVLYKVSFMPITFQGPTYKDGLLVNYSGRALMSDKNEKGVTLTDHAIGRLVSAP